MQSQTWNDNQEELQSFFSKVQITIDENHDCWCALQNRNCKLKTLKSNSFQLPIMILNENAYSNHWKMNTMINSDFSKQPEEKKIGLNNFIIQCTGENQFST